MSLTTVRIVALFVLFAETYLVGIIPLYCLKKWYGKLEIQSLPYSSEEKETVSLSSNAIIQVLLQFGGGVLFATVFTHLIPDIKGNFEKYLQTNESVFKFDDSNENLAEKIPFVEISICGGFFLIFFIEELIHFFVNRFNEHQKVHHKCYNRDLKTRSNVFSDNNHEIQTETKPISSPYVSYGTDNSATNSKKKNSIEENRSSNNVSTFTVTNDSGTNDEKNWFILMFIRGLILIFAFSVHSIFDGLAIGLQNKTTTLWSTFFAISVHKLVIAFVVSLQLFDQSHRMILVAINMALFSIMSPIGIFIVILTEDHLLAENSEANPIVIFLTSIATGTLLYIIFYEILQKDRCERISGFLRFLSILIGFGVMLTINVLISA